MDNNSISSLDITKAMKRLESSIYKTPCLESVLVQSQ